MTGLKPLASLPEIYAAALRKDAADLRDHPLTVSSTRLATVANHIETVAEFLERSHNGASKVSETARS